jgi:carbon starvation protein CstA
MPSSLFLMHTLSVFHWILVLFILATSIVPAWLIVKKAGYAGPLALLTWIPLVNIIMIWVFALSTWPVERKGGQA